MFIIMVDGCEFSEVGNVDLEVNIVIVMVEFWFFFWLD